MSDENAFRDISGPVPDSVELKSTVDYWRRLTNQLRFAFDNGFYINESGYNDGYTSLFRFLKFNQNLDIDLELLDGGYITSRQITVDGGSLSIGEDADVTFLVQDFQENGNRRIQLEIDALTEYSIDLPVNSFGSFVFMVKTDKDRSTTRKYTYATDNENVLVQLESELNVGSSNIINFSVDENSIKFTSITQGQAFLFYTSINSSDTT